jgi:hypothetical protein
VSCALSSFAFVSYYTATGQEELIDVRCLYKNRANLDILGTVGSLERLTVFNQTTVFITYTAAPSSRYWLVNLVVQLTIYRVASKGLSIDIEHMSLVRHHREQNGHSICV